MIEIYSSVDKLKSDAAQKRWVELLVFSFSVGILAQPLLYEVSALCLLLMSGYCVLSVGFKNSLALLSPNERALLFLILCFGVVQVVGGFVQPFEYSYDSYQEKLTAIDYPSRWILTIPIFILLCSITIDWRAPAIGLAIGTLVAASIAHYQVYVEGMYRAMGVQSSSISFAQLMVISDLLLWMFMVRAKECGQKQLVAIFMIASLAGFYASLLAASRGAWLAYVVMGCIWLAYAARGGSRKLSDMFSVANLVRVLLAVFIFFLVSQTSQYRAMEQRTLAMVEGIATQNLEAASGNRASLFQVALESIERHPFGIGTDNFKSLLPEGSQHSHAHNELINAGAENGIQGMLCLLALFGFSTWVFVKKLISGDESQRYYGALGMVLVLSYSVFSASSTVFSNHDTLIFFILYFFYFFSAQERDPNEFVTEGCRRRDADGTPN